MNSADVRPRWSTEILGDLAALERATPDLRALYHACTSATPFQTPEWCAAWARAYGRDRRLRVLIVRRDGVAVAAAPLVRERWLLWQVLRPIGGGQIDFSDVLVDTTHEDEALPALAHALAAVPGCHGIDLPEVRQSARARALLAAWPGRTLRMPASTCLELPGVPVEEYVTRFSRKSAGHRRRELRSVAAAGVEHRRLPASETAAGIDRLLSLHRAQWGGRGINPEHLRPRFRALLQAAAGALVEHGDAELVEHRVDGRVVASEFLVVGSDLVGGYLFGYDPALRGQVSIAAMLLTADLRIAHERGGARFSMMRGGEGYKQSWRPEPAPNERLVLGLGTGPRTQAYLAAVGAGQRARDFVRDHPQVKEKILDLRSRARAALARRR